jgi:hypothetical protein
MIAELRDGSDTGPCRDELDRCSEAGEIDRLEAMGHAIAALLDLEPHWAFDAILSHLLDLLALTSSAERAAAVARVAAGLPDTYVRRVAELLAQAQPERVLVSLLAGDLPTELGACLLHEMILRRKSVTPVADAWAARLAGHPLADLPLHALPGETRISVARFEIGSWSAEHGPRPVDLVTVPGTVPDVIRETASPDVTAAVTTWLTQSNGRAEAAVFALASPLASDEVGVRTLTALGLDCLAGGGLALRRAGLTDAVDLLFGAAAHGGAYDHGFGGAYGRAASWRSLNALAGGSHVGCAWWIFDAANDWFRRVAWDLGVVCLRPGGHVMAVLAATDTD